MPKYYFKVRNIPPEQEKTGEEFANDHAAWKEATVLASEIFKDVDGQLQPGQDWALEVADQDLSPVFQIQIITKKLR